MQTQQVERLLGRPRLEDFWMSHERDRFMQGVPLESQQDRNMAGLDWADQQVIVGVRDDSLAGQRPIFRSAADAADPKHVRTIAFGQPGTTIRRPAISPAKPACATSRASRSSRLGPRWSGTPARA